MSAPNDSPASAPEPGPVASALEQRLRARFSPAHLRVDNESYKHSVPPGSETHFRVVVVSDAFEGLRLVARHRAVNGAVGELLAGPIHALSIQAYTPAQWRERDEGVLATPECRGGGR